MPTSLDREQAEQKRWRLRPNYANFEWPNLLLRREFVSTDVECNLQAGALQHIVRFAASQTPFYRDLFQRLALDPADIKGSADLVKLPILTREVVQENFHALRAEKLPQGETLGGTTKTSGSTGQPVKVLHSKRSLGMFKILKQRHLRWARFDPAGCFAIIRPAPDLPKTPQGATLAEGETLEMDSWALQVGRYYKTGRMIAFSNLNAIDSQCEWLARHNPDYLLCQPAELEHLALAFGRVRPLEGLKGLLSIGQQAPAEMRRQIERAFAVPLHENYGLNEIGIVAQRCEEGGRYHVNAEHCLVEITDNEGRPCPPGARGRLLVTTMMNVVMPLLRYDTGDLAEAAAEGPCPCGRSLPAFGPIHGRFRRLVNLPDGVYKSFSTLRNAMGDLPAELMAPLRQFQVHHYRDGRLELRLVTAGPLAPAFEEHLRGLWRQAGEPAPLSMVRVDSIPRPPGGKFQDFTSDLMPEPKFRKR